MIKSQVIKILSGVIGIVLLISGIYGASYASTPAHIRYPKMEHYHFRAQVIVDGQSVDFSQKEFQEDYVPNLCTIGISKQPFHFHDDQDQLVHVHWDGMTGGEFLKYYGWNFIGGDANTLGKRFDVGFLTSEPVNIYGRMLPDYNEDSEIYVYIGDESNFEQKSLEDFLTQDLEKFFGVNSNLSFKENHRTLWDLLAPKVLAHEGHEGISEEELTKVNNLIGNVVIFAQNSEPNTSQIVEKFANLVPLGESTCGG